MIRDIKDIDWSRVDSYAMDHRLGVLDHVMVAGVRYDLGHLRVRAEDLSYYLGHEPLNMPVAQAQSMQPPQHQQQQYQQQDGHQPQQGGGGQLLDSAGRAVESITQRFVLVFMVSVGAFVAFSFHLAKRLIVDKLNMNIFDVFSDTKEKFTSIFGETTGDFFPDIAMKSNEPVYDQISMVIAFCLLFLPLLYQVIRRPSKVLTTAGFYIVSLVLVASLYNLGVSKDFMDIMGNFPPLLSVNPLTLFGYIPQQ